MFLDNENNLCRRLLVIGCQRSGTTLLSSMLGRHSEINMLFESTTKDVNKLIGKKYNGNKLLAWRQIRSNSRSSKIGHFINRVVNFDYSLNNQKKHKIRIFPTSQLSINDYLNNDSALILMTRKKSEVLKSITNRTDASKSLASYEYDKSLEEMNKYKDVALNIDFSNLIHNTEDTLMKTCEFLNLVYETRMLEGPKFNFIYPHSKIIKSKSNSN